MITKVVKTYRGYSGAYKHPLWEEWVILNDTHKTRELALKDAHEAVINHLNLCQRGLAANIKSGFNYKEAA